MVKATLLLLWLFVLPSLACAGVPAIVATEATVAEAQAAVTAATTALNQATAWESLAREELDKANAILAKTPKSVTAKKAVAAARKELDSAISYKAKTKADLLEKSKIAQTLAAHEEKNESAIEAKNEAKTRAVIYPPEKYNLFSSDYDTADRIDAYYFFIDPLDYSNKTVILDAKFDGMISPGVAKFTIWRNFGNMHLIVSNLPAGDVIPKDKTMLLAGVITGFNKEVVSGELVLNALIKLKGVFICSDSRCHS